MHKKAIFLAVVGLGVLYGIFKFVGTSKIIPVLLGADQYLVLTALLLQVVLMLIWTLRWNIVADYLKLKIPFIRLFPHLLVVNFGDIITPGPRFGAEPLVVYFMEKKEGIKSEDSLTSMLIERIYGVVTFNILAILSIGLLVYYLTINFSIFLLLLVSLLISVGLTYVLFHSLANEKEGLKLATKIADWIIEIAYHLRAARRFGIKETMEEFEKRVNRSMKVFFEEVIKTSKEKELWVVGMLLSFIFYFAIYAQLYVIFLAVGVKVPFYLIVVMLTLSELVGFLILLPSGVGVTELLIITLSTAAGIDIGVAAAATLIVRGIYYGFGLIAGYVAMVYLAEEI